MHPWLKRWLPPVYGASFTAVLVYLTTAASSINREVWLFLVSPASWSSQTPLPRMAAEAVGVVLLVIVHMSLFRRIDRKFEPGRIVEANLNFYPLQKPLWRWPFVVLLLWNLPTLTMLEEFIFRHGMGVAPTVTAGDVVFRSVAFGLFHCLMSLNWRGGIIQTTLAFWFSYQYLLPGPEPLMRASFAHFLVDLIALLPALASLAFRSRKSASVRPACS